MSESLRLETANRLTFAVQAAKAAAAIALHSFQDDHLQVDTKVDRSVVTEADRGAERCIRALLAQAFPADAVAGEEFGEQAGTSGWTWHLDPIDGTQAFVRGVPLFGTLIGVEYGRENRIGVICLPAVRELIYASKGEGCHWIRDLAPDGHGGFTHGAPVRARVSHIGTLSDALFCTTWMKSYIDSGRTELYGKLCAATGIARGWGDCYGYALVATGRAEVMVDPQLAIWDAAPMPVILEEAGGRYTTFDGQADIRGGTGVATNGRLHQDVLQVVAGS